MGKATTTDINADTTASRSLSGSSYTDGSAMNGTACISYCSKKGYTFAGTEYSSDKCHAPRNLFSKILTASYSAIATIRWPQLRLFKTRHPATWAVQETAAKLAVDPTG